MPALSPGLCATCIHARTIQNDRGRVFWLCEAHKINRALPKYPSLPVLNCAEYVAHETHSPQKQALGHSEKNQ